MPTFLAKASSGPTSKAQTSYYTPSPTSGTLVLSWPCVSLWTFGRNPIEVGASESYKEGTGSFEGEGLVSSKCSRHTCWVGFARTYGAYSWQHSRLPGQTVLKRVRLPRHSLHLCLGVLQAFPLCCVVLHLFREQVLVLCRAGC